MKKLEKKKMNLRKKLKIKKIKNVVYTIYNKLKRKKLIHYDNSITYTDWVLFGTREDKKICEK